MEKITRNTITFLAFLLATCSLFSQELITTLKVDVSQKLIESDTTLSDVPRVYFGDRNYDNSFVLKSTGVSGGSFFIGMSNDIAFNKNLISTYVGLGSNRYDYALSLNLLNTGSDSAGLIAEDATKWNDLLAAEDNLFTVRQNYPAMRFALGYKRELFYFRKLAPYAETGLQLEYRFSISAQNSLGYLGSTGKANVELIELFNHRSIFFSPYLGFGFRFGGTTLGTRTEWLMGQVTNGQGIVNFTERSYQFYYAKTLGLSRLGKEQIIYDEYQHISTAKSSEYRMGDKFSFISFTGANHKFVDYQNQELTTDEIIVNNDTLSRITEGFLLTPNVGISFNFNTFATHRLLIGLGLGVYEEKYRSYGYVEGGNLTGQIPFRDEEATLEEANPYVAYSVSQRGNATANLAVYISKKILPVDPFVKLESSMILDYNVPSFLKDNPDWRSVSFFPITKVGAGIDFRIRIKNSKFLVFGIGADYVFNPHVNFVLYSTRLGYYRKKKLKNQRY